MLMKKEILENNRTLKEKNKVLKDKLKSIYKIIHEHCYYPELENHTNDLTDEDIFKILDIIGEDKE